MTRQATDQLYIDLEYFTPEEYYVYVAEVSANTASAFNLSADVEVVEPSGEIVEATGAFTAEFAQTTLSGKLLDVELQFEALFTPIIAAEGIKNSFAVLDTTATLEATTSKFTGYESLQEFFAALNAQAARTRTTDSAQSAEFSADILAASTKEFNSSLAVSFDLTAQAQVVNFVDYAADLASQSNITASYITYKLRPRPNPYNRPNNTLQLRTIVSFSRVEKAVTNSYFFDNSNLTFNNLQGDYSWIFGNDEGGHLFASLPNLNIGGGDFHFSFFYFRNHGDVINTVNERFIARLGSAASSIQTLGSTRLEWRNDDPVVITLVRTGSTTLPTIRLRVFNTFTIEGGTFNSGRITVQKVGNVVTLFVNGSNRGSITLTSGLGSVNQIEFQPHQDARPAIIDDAILKLDTTSNTNGIQTNDDFTAFHYLFEQDLLDNFDTTITHIGESSLVSVSNLTASVGGLFTASSVQETSASLNADIDKVIVADANLTASFAQTAEVLKLQGFDIDLSSNTVLNADVIKLVDAAVSLNSNFNQVVDYTRIRDAVIQTESIATKLVAIARIGQGLITLESSFNQTAQATLLVDGAATLAADFTQDAVAQNLRGFDANLDSSFAQTADVDKLSGVAIVATSDFTLAVDVDKTTDYAAVLNTEFTQTTDSLKFAGNQIVLNTAFVQTTDSQRFRSADIILDAAADLVASATTDITGEAELVSTASLDITPLIIRSSSVEFESIATKLVAVARIGQGLITLESSFNQTTDARVTTGNVVGLDVAADLTADLQRNRFASANLNSNFEITAFGFTDKDIVVQLDSEAGLTTDAHVIADFLVSADSAAILTADSSKIMQLSAELEALNSKLTLLDKFAGLTVDITVESNLLADANRIGNTSAAASSSFELESAAQRIRFGDSELNTEFNQTAAFGRIRPLSADIVSALDFEVSVIAQREGEIIVPITATLTATGSVTRDLEAELDTVSDVAAQGALTFTAEALLNAEFTITAQGRLFATLDLYTYRIPREQRTFSIAREQRHYTISKEDRTHIIRG
jgi:hypothetical protein